MSGNLDVLFDKAMVEITRLSGAAKEAGDLPTMYKANAAWRELYDARADIEARRARLKTAEGKVG